MSSISSMRREISKCEAEIKSNNEINKNIILCLNMVDELNNKQIEIDIEYLKEILKAIK